MSRFGGLTRTALLLALCPAPLPARQESPAMFRGGPAHLGVYPGGAGGIVGVQWRFPTGGDVVGSPAVFGGVVYAGSGDGFLYAVRERSGALLWRTELKSPIASSPAVLGTTVYITTRDGRLHALDRASGRVRWHHATRPELPFPWGHESGDRYISSPTLAGGLVLFGSGDGHLYAVSAATGKLSWRARTEGRVRSTPAVADGRVFVGSFDGRVYAFDLATGALRWRNETEGAGLRSGNFGFDRRSVQSSAAVAKGTVFIGARDGFLYALDAASGQLRWRFNHEISWVNASPAVADGFVYVGSSDGQFVQAVEAATGKEVWRTKLGVIVWSSAALAGDRLYVGDGSGKLLALARADGRVLGTFRTGGQVFSSPVVSGDLVLFGSNDGGLYALRLGGPPVERAVFFDSSVVRASLVANGAEVARYLGERGYRTLDTAGVTRWLAERTSDPAPSVVVFAMDFVPGSVSAGLAESALRRYLAGGGKVVWLGLPPLLWPRDPATGRRSGLDSIAWTAPEALLGVSHAGTIFDSRAVRPTEAGRRWGLPARWRSAWGIAPGAVSEVLGVDDWNLAAAWVRSYGGPEGTGFVRIPAEDLLGVFLAAEYRPRRS